MMSFKCCDQQHKVQLVNFDKGKFKVLHIASNNSRHWYRPGADQLESSLAEEELRVDMDNRLTIRQQ